jgi:hypothetical protein
MQKTHSSTASLVVAALLLSAGAARLEAQATTGTIRGIVKDTSGAVLADVTVTATHALTNFSRQGVSDSRGEYAIEFLPLGSYRLEAAMTGFQTFARTGIVAEVGRTARVDPVLSVGATETVTVSADAPLVDTSHATLGRTVTAEEVENLPLVDRDLYTLLELTPGVDATETTNVFGSPGQETLVNGSANASAGAVNYNLDGGSNASGLRNTGNPIPNPDAVQEFRVSTNSYSAEYGRFAGGVVDVVTKSGTNDFQGSLFEFFRNEKLNAARWSPVPTNIEKDPLKRNNFGGTFGGPLRKDRAFFFVSYSGLRQTTTAFKNEAVVPSALERRGDFSQSARKPNDPLTGQPFPNGQIPLSRFDPVALRILNDYIPLANLPGNFYEVGVPRPVNKDEIQLKLTHALSSSHQLVGSYFMVKGDEHDVLRGNLPWVDRVFSYKQQNFNLSDTWIAGPSKINELRVTYLRNFGGRLNTPEISLGDLGSRFNIQGAPSLPQIQVQQSNFNLTSAIAGPVAGSNFYQVRDVLSLSKGRHSIRVGGEGSLDKVIHDTTLNNYGNFTFNGSKTGNALADFFLGLPNQFSQDAPVTKTDNTWYLGLFIQDDFKVHPRLILNLGLRYDLQTPYVDPQDRKTTFVPGRQSTVVPTALPGMLFPGDEGVGRGIAPVDKNNFAPRLGFAWDVKGDGRTAVRGAFGVFYGTISGNMWNATADGQPFSIRQTFTNPGTLSDPYRNLPGGVSPFPYEYDAASPRFVFPAGISGPSLDFTMAYTYQMNLAVQRQLGSSASATVAYVGAMGYNLPFDRDINYPVLGPGATAANRDSRRPYSPGRLARITQIQSVLGNDYHGLQVTAEKRIGRRFQAQGSYVFSKSLEDAQLQDDLRGGAQNMNDIAAERGRTDNDRRHVVKLSAIARTDYFDRDRRRFLHAVLDGWTLSTIFIWRSGAPINITDSNDRNLDGQTNDRPNLVGDPNLSHGRSREELIAEWFSRAAFTRAALGADGDAGRNIVDGPGRTTLDLGLFRDFGLGRGMKLQARLDASNAFNIVNLMNPGTNLNTPATFGRIREAREMRQVQLGLRLSF